ncbi:MAG TPA: LuxR C-terminal-related transcriptional regulator [Phycisphaerales bacterium]|nr:LuxR C-terminal-related transcriptional regulator [Phycisphaerales bacterium]
MGDAENRKSGESENPLSELGACEPMLEAVWSVLTTEPGTGVGLLTAEGELLYVNEQAVKIFHGPDAKPAEYTGRKWEDHMPEDWTKERLALLQRIRVSGKPVLLRNIWRGQQHFTYIYPIQREGDGPDLFLTITRRAESDEQAEELAKGDYEWIDAEVANLGPLDALSARELEVLALLGQGLSVKEIAKLLYRSEHTIVSHRKAIGAKLGVDDRVKLALIARRAGLTVRDVERTRVEEDGAKT